MKFILNILLVISIAFSSLAQNPKTELDLLKVNYERAVERSTKTLTEQYKKELQKLLEKYSKKGDIKEVDRITSILKEFDDAAPFNIIDSEWISESGTTFRFKDGGKGRRYFGTDSTELSWRYVENGNIVITTRKSDGGPIVIIYMKLTNTTGLYGDTPDKMTSTITKIK